MAAGFKHKQAPQAKREAKDSGKSAKPYRHRPVNVIPGEMMLGQGDIVAFEGRQTIELNVANTGDRPIQVGSHCHFFEANRALRFDREKAYGFRLRIPAGTAVRFEPGEEKRVTLVTIGGNRVAYGINGLTHGKLDNPQVKNKAVARASELGFLSGKR
jgi:urease beta subunit